MLRIRRRTSAGQIPAPKSSKLSPIVIGLGIWALFPATIAMQDTASLMAGGNTDSRWAHYLEASPAGSSHAAQLPLIDKGTSSLALASAGTTLPNGSKVAFYPKDGARHPLSDEARVNRSTKTSRVIKTLSASPPKAFSAGSVLDRHSFLTAPDTTIAIKTAFAKPKHVQDEIKVATTFHTKRVIAPSEPPRAVAKLFNNNQPDVLATAYAPPKIVYGEKSPFDALFAKEQPRKRFVPPIERDDHAWARNTLPKQAFSKREQACLARGIYFEARGEPVEGQAAVAQVILNRVRNPQYPGTICKVVYQNKHWRNRCQFSFACDGIRDRITSPHHYQIAEEVALAVTAGKIWLDQVGSSTHYHATYVNPRWGATMRRVGKIGKHIFYRTHGGGWS